MLHRAVLLLPLLALGCGGPPPTRPFAEGDLYDFKEASASDDEEEDAAKKDATEATPAITLPRDRGEVEGLVLTAKPSQTTVRAGNPLNVTAVLRNTTTNARTLTYNTTKRFDAVIYADAEMKTSVYLWSETQPFENLFQRVILNPGTTQTRILDIDTTRDTNLRDGSRADLSAPLPPGKYFLFVTHEGTPLLATRDPIEITVVEE